MGTNTSAIRAITAVFFRRILKWAIILVIAVMVVSFVLTAVLAITFSVYWWLLLIVIWPFCIVALLVGAGLWVATNRLQPRHFTKNERRRLLAFTDKIFGITENARTPYPLLFVMVGKDVIRGKQSSFIANTINDTWTLRSDYEEIRKIV